MSIRELREAVEAGIATGGPDAMVVPFKMGELIEAVFGDDDETWSEFVGAHDGSVDDALKLAGKVLPGWGWALEANSAACVWHPDTFGRSRDIYLSDTPSRALLIAILRALEEEGQG